MNIARDIHIYLLGLPDRSLIDSEDVAYDLGLTINETSSWLSDLVLQRKNLESLSEFAGLTRPISSNDNIYKTDKAMLRDIFINRNWREK